MSTWAKGRPWVSTSGAGSFELAVGNCYDIYLTTSAPVGATRLKGELGVRERLDREVRKEIPERVREALETTGRGWPSTPGWPAGLS